MKLVLLFAYSHKEQCKDTTKTRVPVVENDRNTGIGAMQGVLFILDAQDLLQMQSINGLHMHSKTDASEFLA